MKIKAIGFDLGNTLLSLPESKESAALFDDVEWVLKAIKDRNIRIGILCPPGEEAARPELDPIRKYVDGAVTADICGPHPEDYERLLKELGFPPEEMLFVGDEEKDVKGARSAGIRSVLICRKGTPRPWGQDHTIVSMGQIFDVIARIGR